MSNSRWTVAGARTTTKRVPGRGGRLLGLDHGGEALGVHERHLAEVEHDLLGPFDGAGQLRAQDVDRRQVDVALDGDDLRRVLRRDVDAEILIGDCAIISVGAYVVRGSPCILGI